MCKIRLNMKKIIFAVIITSVLCSCSSSLLIKFGEDGRINFEYSAVCGKELTETISSISGGDGQNVFEADSISLFPEKRRTSEAVCSKRERMKLRCEPFLRKRKTCRSFFRQARRRRAITTKSPYRPIRA